MATSLLVLDSPGVAVQRQESKLLNSGTLLTAALAVFAIAVNGYHPYAEDGGLYVAGVKRLLDPTLYPESASFVLEHTHFSVFAPLLAEFVRLSHLSLPVVLLLLHFASIWATLLAGWMLAKRCWRSQAARVGAVALLACLITVPVAGTALLLMDPYVTARSFSTPCMVLALVGALESTELDGRRMRGLGMWAGGILLAGAMHPLMAAYALGATLLLASLRSPKRGVRAWGTAAMCAAAVGFAAGLQTLARPESADYVQVAMTRMYWFPAEWRWFEQVGLAAPLVILAVPGWSKPTSQKRDPSTGSGQVVGYPALRKDEMRGFFPFTTLRVRMTSSRKGASLPAMETPAQMAVVAGATACVVAMLFARVHAATHLVARLQPLRAFQMVYLVMVLTLGAKLGEWVLGQSAWRWIAAMLVLGGVMFGAARADFAHSRHLELPGIAARNGWVQAFVWIRENTPKDALFALDADYINAPQEDAQCFRAIAERSALPDYSKDGGEASIAPELTAEWQTGQAAQRGLSAPGVTDEQRVSALKPLGVNWLVMQSGAETNLNCPYTNDIVRVCRLR